MDGDIFDILHIIDEEKMNEIIENEEEEEAVRCFLKILN